MPHADYLGGPSAREPLHDPMFGRSKPIVFESYGRRRSRWQLPAWLWLLLAGTALGAGAVLVVQSRYLPPRLTAAASVELRAAFDQADSDRRRLAVELAESRRQLAATAGDMKSALDEAAAGRASVERLRADLASAVAALPNDPRGGVVEVRAGRLTAAGGMLSYDVVLTRERGGGKQQPGVLQLVVAGESEQGKPASVPLKSVALATGSHQVVRGSQPLPEGFKARQTTIQVLDRPGGQALGMRILPVK
jgi:hypothetical protein